MRLDIPSRHISLKNKVLFYYFPSILPLKIGVFSCIQNYTTERNNVKAISIVLSQMKDWFSSMSFTFYQNWKMWKFSLFWCIIVYVY